MFLYGAWHFIPPVTGWTAHIADEAQRAQWDGTDWVTGVLAMGTTGAMTRHSVAEVAHTAAAGAIITAGLIIPNKASLFCVSDRVTGAITGTLTTFSAGIDRQASKFSSGLSPALDSTFTDPSGLETFWADTSVRIFGEDGDFTFGQITLAAHYMHYAAPG